MQDEIAIAIRYGWQRMRLRNGIPLSCTGSAAACFGPFSGDPLDDQHALSGFLLALVANLFIERF
jgi:hypothetical protein